MKMDKKYIVAITGATGAPLALHFLKTLLAFSSEVHLLFSDMGKQVFYQELKILKETSLTDFFKMHCKSHYQKIRFWDVLDFSAPFASGSGFADAMIIVPCSMKTLSAVSNGYSSTLIERSADVMLKEKRPLILVPRETPLNQIHLRNLLLASQAGAHILPPVPAFYTDPKNIEDILSYITGKILDSLTIRHDLFPRWSETGKM